MGRRWGKTYMSGVLSAAVADHGGQVAWVVPTYANSRPAWRFVEVLTSQSQKVRELRADRRFEFPSGGWLGVYTADNDVSMRGESFDLVIVDEAAQVREETWTDVIMPTLADRNGRAMLISTPKGRNWFWREWQRGQADGKEQASFRAPTSANPMPSIRRAFELARERVSSRTYRQEWLAEFVEDGAGVFRNVRACATAQVCAPYAGQFVIGVDWGRTDDATVFVCVDVEKKSVCDFDRMTQTDYGLQRGRLRAMWERWGRPAIVAELNSMGGPIVEQLQREGMYTIGFTTTNATKTQIIDGLALAFEQRTIGIIPDETLISELEAYESDRLPSGLVRYSAPAGLHDDTVMALALAWQYAARPSIGFAEM